jgi:PAS domain-containing protein
VPFIIVTGSLNEETAVDCMKAGASDYVIKEHLMRLGPAVLNALDRKRALEEKQQAEVALKKSEAVNRAVLEAVLDCIITINHNGEIISSNTSAADTFGFGREELLGHKVTDLLAASGTDTAQFSLFPSLGPGVLPAVGQRAQMTRGERTIPNSRSK